MATYVNGRGAVHGGSGGRSVAGPDVCKTPAPGSPVPVPYVNLGQSADTVDGPSSVTIEGHMPMVKGAKYRKSSGDQSGSVGGLISGTTGGECEFVTYSFDVSIEGRNACRLGDQLTHNKKNAVGGLEIGEPSLPSASSQRKFNSKLQPKRKLRVIQPFDPDFDSEPGARLLLTGDGTTPRQGTLESAEKGADHLSTLFEEMEPAVQYSLRVDNGAAGNHHWFEQKPLEELDVVQRDEGQKGDEGGPRGGR